MGIGDRETTSGSVVVSSITQRTERIEFLLCGGPAAGLTTRCLLRQQALGLGGQLQDFLGVENRYIVQFERVTVQVKQRGPAI